jgi:hypothetical protein
MIRPLRWCTSLLFAVAILITARVAAAAQTPSTAPAAAPAPRTPHKPTNLKVLPENTDIRAVMHQYEAALGVHCSFCHAAADETTHRTDFASDANVTKDTARYMIQMTADLNNKYLANMPRRVFDDPITCGTCHRGQARPPVFVAPPEAEGNRPPSAPGAMPPPAAPGVPPATGSSR